jgi:MFS family permease
LLVDTVGKEGLGQAIGYVSMALSIGTMAGPLLGGVLYEDGGYYSVFGLAFGLIGIDIFLRLVLIEKRHAARWIAPETKHMASGEEESKREASMGAITNSPTLSNGPKSDTPEEKPVTRSPLRQIASLLSSYRLVVSLWGYFVISLVLTSFDSVLPIFVEETFGWEQTGQGLIFIPLMVPHILDPIAGFIIDRYRWAPRYLTAAGFLCVVPVATLLRVVKENTMHDKIVLCALLALLGCCISMVMTPIVTEVFNAVQEKEDRSPNIFGRGGATALAFGLSNMGFAAGSLIGPFFAGFIRQNAGWGTMGWAMGLVAGVSAIPNLLFVGGWILRKSKPAAPGERTESETP